MLITVRVVTDIPSMHVWQVALSKGRARAFDHAQLVHGQWLHAAKERMSLYVVRVATELNIADLPSRGEFQLLEEQGAVYVEPRLEEPHLQQEYWEVLKERWCVV